MEGGNLMCTCSQTHRSIRHYKATQGSRRRFEYLIFFPCVGLVWPGVAQDLGYSLCTPSGNSRPFCLHYGPASLSGGWWNGCWHRNAAGRRVSGKPPCCRISHHCDVLKPCFLADSEIQKQQFHDVIPLVPGAFCLRLTFWLPVSASVLQLRMTKLFWSGIVPCWLWLWRSCSTLSGPIGLDHQSRPTSCFLIIGLPGLAGLRC